MTSQHTCTARAIKALCLYIHTTGYEPWKEADPTQDNASLEPTADKLQEALHQEDISAILGDVALSVTGLCDVQKYVYKNLI